MAELLPQADTCGVLLYRPSTTREGQTYTLNGAPLTDIPIELSEIGTYLVTATAAPDAFCDSGPPARDTFTVGVSSTAAIITPDTVVCDQGDTFTLQTREDNGDWTINGEPFDGRFDPALRPSGPYELVYGNPPCISPDTITVEVIGTDITGPEDQALCVDQGAVTFTPVTPGGVFSDSAGLVTEAGVFDPGAAPLGESTIYYSTAGATTCRGIDSFTVTVSELNVSFETDTCTGTEVCFIVPEFTAGDGVSWSFDGNDVPGNDTGGRCYDFQNAGNYPVSVTVTRGACENTFAEDVVLADAPGPAFDLVFADDSCSVLDVTVVNRTPDVPGNSYAWLLDGELRSEESTLDNLSLTAFGENTSYELTLSVGNACTERSVSESITVVPAANASFEPERDNYCSGETIRVRNQSSGNGITSRWLVDGVPNESLQQGDSLIYDTGTQDTVEICLIAANKCLRDTSCREIVIRPTDVEAFFNLPGPAVCAGDSFRIRNGANEGVPVEYFLDDEPWQSAANPFVALPEAGTYEICQRAYGCGSGIVCQTLTVNETPRATISGPLFGCPGEPLSFTTTDQPSVAYAWEVSDGRPMVPEAAFAPTFDTAGVFQVCLTVTSLAPEGCSRRSCQTVTIAAPPVSGVMVSDSTCFGDPIIFSSSAAAGPSCRYTFSDGGSFPDCAGSYVLTGSGRQSITQIVTDEATGCMDSITLPVFVRSLPLVTFISPSDPICAPETVALTNASTNANGFTWARGGDTLRTRDAEFDFASPGNYTIELTATNDGLCPVSTSQTITVAENPVAVIAPLQDPVCQDQELTFTSSSGRDGNTLQWAVVPDTIGFGPSFSISFTEVGPSVVSLVVTNEDGCTDITSEILDVAPAVSAGPIEALDVSCFGQATGSLTISPAGGTTPFTVSWSDGADGAERTDLPAGPYVATVTDGNGCQDSSRTEILEPSPIETGSKVGTVTCFGGTDGSIALNVSGGTPVYQVRWPDGGGELSRDQLSAGDYTLIISDANACEVERIVSVPEALPITFIDSLNPHFLFR